MTKIELIRDLQLKAKDSVIHAKIKDSMSSDELIQQMLSCFYGLNDKRLQEKLIFDLDKLYQEELGLGYVVRCWNEYRADVDRLATLTN